MAAVCPSRVRCRPDAASESESGRPSHGQRGRGLSGGWARWSRSSTGPATMTQAFTVGLGSGRRLGWQQCQCDSEELGSEALGQALPARVRVTVLSADSEPECPGLRVRLRLRLAVAGNSVLHRHGDSARDSDRTSRLLACPSRGPGPVGGGVRRAVTVTGTRGQSP